LKEKAITCLDKTCQNQVSDTSLEEESDDDVKSSKSQDSLNALPEMFEDSLPTAINKITNGN